MTEDQKREIIKTFLDINKPCEEGDFNGCADLKKKYIEELNRPGGCVAHAADLVLDENILHLYIQG